MNDERLNKLKNETAEVSNTAKEEERDQENSTKKESEAVKVRSQLRLMTMVLR